MSAPLRWSSFVCVALSLCACDKARFVALDAGPTIAPRAIPERPADDDLPPDAAPQVYVLRDITLRSAEPGWDLDGQCTFPSTSPDEAWEAECTAVDASAPLEDLDECVDDAFGTEVAGAFQPLGATLEQALAASMQAGVGALLVRVTGHSGGADDSEVSVELAPTGYGVPPGGVRGDPLTWAGMDSFFALDTSLGPDLRANLVDEQAYVAGGILVARFSGEPSFTFRGLDRSIEVQLHRPVFTARLGATGLTEARLSGRWATSHILEQLDAAGLCAGDPLRVAAENRIRSVADVYARPDSAEVGAPCDALSASIQFAAFRGLWGLGTEPATAAPRLCPSP